jgi:hypothetical protein
MCVQFIAPSAAPSRKAPWVPTREEFGKAPETGGKKILLSMQELEPLCLGCPLLA